MNRKQHKPEAKESADAEARRRDQRLAEALHQNLRRRKNQARERAGENETFDRSGSPGGKSNPD